MTGRLVRTNGIRLFIRELGDATTEPPVLMLHGGPDWDHSYLWPGAERVARDRRVILTDFRGCGRSTQGLGIDGYQPEYIVDDLVGLVEALGYEQVDLFGHSTGGQVAQLVVERAPERIRRLVLGSTTAYPVSDELRAERAQAAGRTTVAVDWPDWAPHPKPDEPHGADLTITWAVESAPANIFDLDRLDDYLDLLGEIHFSGEWMEPFEHGLLHPWRPTDPEQNLIAYGRPVLVLHGVGDLTYPVELAERLAHAVPNAELHLIENAAHMAQFDQPEEWAAAIVRFLGAGPKDAVAE